MTLIKIKLRTRSICDPELNLHVIVVGVVVYFKAASLTRDRPMGGVAFRGVFLRDPIPYSREFRRKPQKTPNG